MTNTLNHFSSYLFNLYFIIFFMKNKTLLLSSHWFSSITTNWWNSTYLIPLNDISFNSWYGIIYNQYSNKNQIWYILFALNTIYPFCVVSCWTIFTLFFSLNGQNWECPLIICSFQFIFCCHNCLILKERGNVALRSLDTPCIVYHVCKNLRF